MNGLYKRPMDILPYVEVRPFRTTSPATTSRIFRRSRATGGLVNVARRTLLSLTRRPHSAHCTTLPHDALSSSCPAARARQFRQALKPWFSSRPCRYSRARNLPSHSTSASLSLICPPARTKRDKGAGRCEPAPQRNARATHHSHDNQQAHHAHNPVQVAPPTRPLPPRYVVRVKQVVLRLSEGSHDRLCIGVAGGVAYSRLFGHGLIGPRRQRWDRRLRLDVARFARQRAAWPPCRTRREREDGSKHPCCGRMLATLSVLHRTLNRA